RRVDGSQGTVMRPLPAVLFAWFAIALAGCGSNAPISAPPYDPDAMANAAMQQFDKNGNGTLEGTELDACPGLKAALVSIDTNSDKKISLDELKTRFEVYQNLGAGAIGYSVQVSLDGFPFPDAT